MINSSNLKQKIDSLWNKFWFRKQRKHKPALLFVNPLTNFGKDAVDKLFAEEYVNDLVELTKKLVA